VKEEQEVSFGYLKMSNHDFMWWESYVNSLWLGKKELVTKSEHFKELTKEFHNSNNNSNHNLLFLSTH